MNDVFIQLPSGKVFNARYIQALIGNEVLLLRSIRNLDDKDAETLKKVLLAGGKAFKESQCS